MAEAGLDAEVADILAGVPAKPANIPEISVEKVLTHSPGSRRAKKMGTPTFDRDTPVLSLTPLRGSPASGSGGEENFLNKYDSKGSPKLSHRSKSETKLYEDDSDRSKLSKKESLKEQKKNYRREKKRAAKELLNTLKDPSVVVLRDWLKIRGTLKGWQKYWCVLKPGVLIIYKGPKHGAWVGTILLNACEIIERPSKMNGFCFKVFHPLDQSIWASKGPKGETVPAITQPLPTSYLILRAATDADGRCWMDAMELSLRCSSLLMRSMVKDAATNGQQSMSTLDTSDPNQQSRTLGDDLIFPSSWNESDIERHFQVHLALGRTITTQNGEEEEKEEKEEEKDEDEKESKGSDSEASEQHDQVFEEDLEPPKETVYRENTCEELGQQGGASQTEEVADENKSIIWTLIKQVRPGMDLSRVVLPTFILEPRSFLDKLSDYYYHADLLSDAVNIDDPFGRMKQIVRWYLSGFYKKPKGLKKPYNPILGETFRCMWPHPQTGSKTFFIAEQVSHHPPVSAFYVTNRQDGFCINGSILCKSKFYGNSLSAILDGTACLTLLNRGEDYAITMPYVSCKGILYGTMTMEMGGKVSLTCDKTGYRTEIEFKLKPFLGGSDASNQITGKIKLGKETLATLEGHWDQDVYITEKSTGSDKTEVFWSVTDEVKSRRLKRQTVRFEDQGDFESEKLWQHVSAAIMACDQNKATNEKYILEEQQRKDARERKEKRSDWVPKLFEREGAEEHNWIYKHIDTRPWDPHNDVFQYEFGGVIQAKTRHKTPMVRTTSIMSVPGTQRQQSLKNRKHLVKPPSQSHRDSDRSSSEPRPDEDDASDDERSDVSSRADSGRGPQSRHHYAPSTIEQAVRPLVRAQQETNDRLADLSGRLRMLANQNAEHSNYLQNKDWLLLAVVMLFQVVTMYMFSR
ncbi:oxysterol-binding protein-related protein 8-like isoform X2 [Branchiostoma floridae x Branchiostoma japonicum]